ncbi:MAG: hypothetical protein A2848_03160 [Candidatus Magasanikbacteria bacterium RIFCSPHIGHO2_01_FULL_50_8]|uniref:Uncharacterized protein n=2 Tax=Candidatus Magasanikiibacteriota TaxID=1752731 RepID=A0A1F6LS15_9BACT|nr:MAG: hypothetical protein A2848_03160 [Candidatus Magasanikbacteria bacterium RIFCSPHIGHO2_01_FULL_50_8]OGH67814.1 MAG: hypothetical protein A3C15_02015 [Candidatus Magasanikbacteria bacterium RIFCSPHIGHO2_02_FULL_50_9b]
MFVRLANRLNSDPRAHFFALYFVALISAALLAIFLYSGSARAIQFPFFLVLISIAVTPIARFIVLKKPMIIAHRDLLDAGVFVVLALPITFWIAADFSPLLLWLCVALGAATLLALERSTLPHRHTLALIVCVLLGYEFGNTYGIGVVLISMFALTHIRQATDESSDAITRLTLVVLFTVFINSIAFAGRSVLFELGDPYVIAGLLLSIVAWKKIFTTTLSMKRGTLIALCVPPLFIVLFGKNHGTVLLGALIVGLIIALIAGHEKYTDHSTRATQIFSVIALLGVSIILVPLIFR